MYPLKVTLIGCGGDLRQLLRLELSARGVRVEAEYLGVESALASMKEADAPGRGAGKGREGLPEGPRRLFVVNIESPRELPAIKRLSSYQPGHPILVIVDAQGDPGVPIQAMRMGASQVVAMPLQADDFRMALECIANQFAAPVSNEVLAVAGVTGGCGATTLAINLACEIAFAQAQRRVVLAELSLAVGKLPLYLNVEPRGTTYDLLKDARRLDLYYLQQALTPIADRFSILAGPFDSAAPLDVSAADVRRLIECLRQSADIVVLDVPCTYDALYFDTLTAADQVVLVGEQKVPSIRALQMVHGKLTDTPHHLLLNRYDPALPGFGLDRLQQMLQTDELMTVASDYPAVSAAINHGLPLRLKEPRCKVLADISQIAARLVPPEATVETQQQRGSMLGGLIRALGIKK